MRVEFNGNGFRADMNDGNEKFAGYQSDFKNIITNNWSLVLGIFSLILSVINLPFGLFMNLNKQIFKNANEINFSYWMAILLVFSIVFVVVSILSGVFSILCYSKSCKKTTDVAGVLLSIVSFLVCATVITLDVVGLII